MKPRFKIQATVDTTAHANTIINSITNSLSGKSVFETHSLSVIKDEANTLVILDCRFNNQIDMDTVKNFIKNQITNHPQVKNWVSQASASWHECFHDEEVVTNCGQSKYFEWSK